MLPTLDTIESNETTVARCSDLTTWWRYAERTGLVTPVAPMTTSSAGSAIQNEVARPMAIAAADSTAPATSRSVVRLPQKRDAIRTTWFPAIVASATPAATSPEIQTASL